MKDRATVICRRKGDVLFVRRRVRWALPGGTIRARESPLECAHRELTEETSLELGTMTYLWQFGGLNKRHHVFLTNLDETVQASPRAQNEIRFCRWFSVSETDGLLLSVPARAILKLALVHHCALVGGVSVHSSVNAAGRSDLAHRLFASGHARMEPQ
jgi:8-oxo-dGTP diphosphatase